MNQITHVDELPEEKELDDEPHNKVRIVCRDENVGKAEIDACWSKEEKEHLFNCNCNSEL